MVEVDGQRIDGRTQMQYSATLILVLQLHLPQTGAIKWMHHLKISDDSSSSCSSSGRITLGHNLGIFLLQDGEGLLPDWRLHSSRALEIWAFMLKRSSQSSWSPLPMRSSSSSTERFMATRQTGLSPISSERSGKHRWRCKVAEGAGATAVSARPGATHTRCSGWVAVAVYSRNPSCTFWAKMATVHAQKIQPVVWEFVTVFWCLWEFLSVIWWLVMCLTGFSCFSVFFSAFSVLLNFCVLKCFCVFFSVFECFFVFFNVFRCFSVFFQCFQCFWEFLCFFC